MIRKLFFLLITTPLLFSCSKDLSEEEQYEELKKSLIYSTYKSASEVGVKHLLEGFQTEVKKQRITNDTPLSMMHDYSPGDAHGVLGLSWIMSQKPVLAIAEANISLELQSDKKNKYLVTSVLAIAMYQKGWKKLASKTSDEASAILNDKTLANELYNEQVSAYLAYGILSLKEGDIQGTRTAFAALGALTGITWLSEVTESMLLIKQGEIQNGLSRLKKVSEDPMLPEPDRIYIRRIIEKVETEIGDIDGDLFMVKVFGKIVFERILEKDDGPFREFVSDLEELKNNLPIFGT